MSCNKYLTIESIV